MSFVYCRKVYIITVITLYSGVVCLGNIIKLEIQQTFAIILMDNILSKNGSKT